MKIVAESRAGVFEGEVEPHAYNNTTLSVIIRFHKKERLPFLEEALFSLAIQHWHDLETIIVLQNGTDDIRDAVTEIIEHQPWRAALLYKILSVDFPTGIDGRSALLNHGISNATGRYLSFLDDDDVVYQHGYSTLIRQLMEGGRSVAIGGCRTAETLYGRDHRFIKIKKMPYLAWGRTRLDLLRLNFVPLRSYVIDRARLGDFQLFFDDAFSPLEGYDFLLRLCAIFKPDFSRLSIPVHEYRIRLDGSKNLPHVNNEPPQATAAVERARQLIMERKRETTCLMTIDEAAEYKRLLLGERRRLPLIAARHVSRYLNTLRVGLGALFLRHPRLKVGAHRTLQRLLGENLLNKIKKDRRIRS